jgi:anti-sigma-K factor RskA
MTDTQTTPSERDDVELLLPWYATGRLDAEDQARVERWLAKDAALARQLELIEDDRLEAVRSNEAERLPATLSVRSMTMKIAPQEDEAATGLLGHIRRLFTAPTVSAVRFAAAAAAIVFLVQAAWLGTLLSRDQARYEPASGGSAIVNDGSYALVRFTDAATAKDIAAALATLNMSIVEGPRQGNLFRVRIGDKSLSEAARDERIGALRRQSTLVMLATPATGR